MPTTYVALSAALGTIAFCFLLPTLVVGTGMLLMALVGAPLIALAFVFCHLLARVERRRARRAARRRLPQPQAAARRLGAARARWPG